MNEWLPIASAPKDGSVVHVRRIYNGRLVKEGEAVFDVPDKEAPMLTPLGPDPLGRPVDYAGEVAWCERAKVTGRWLNADRMHAFPEPTEWMPQQGNAG